MFYYWYRILRILVSRKFQKQVDINAELTRTFRVRLFDCDGLRVMTASKYPAYMDFIRWELIARTKLFNEIVLKGLAPTLGSQKLIYRKPLKRWTKFTVRLKTAGWDDKWVYHIHKFEQNSEVKAIGVTKALIWKKDKPQILLEILENAGVDNIINPPPEWVLQLFNNDSDIISERS
ncbi:thioesterase family protein [Aliifodinibius sp. S!AR15-10]|uniref:acyl-CoA thioesterase n=1 Tax=Aliifodinibius sp. S!AR15-10 TaxID=2950437 RepID=UPI00285D3BA4|nr:acyl-CoA thioesterase [Aliifodinibius sp. S!AR15-10]MDR8391875.1 thioesterase family protein [Aliifodinibius sp. S!AR15-10]